MKHNWTYKKLGEVVKCYRGLTYSKADEVPVSSKMVLRSNNIDLDTHALNFDEIKCVREDLPIADDRKLKKDSIFICMSNGSMQHLGKVAYVDKDYDYAFGGFMGLIVPNPQEVFPKYVYYSLLAPNFLATILREGRGANINNLRFTDLENYSLPMPAKDEQQAIVRELDGINRLIDLQEEQLREYDRLAQSLFYTTFGDPATNPKGWEVKKLGDITSKCNTISWSNVAKDDNYYYVDLTSVVCEIKQIVNPQQVNAASAPSRAKQIILEGDILFGTTRPTQRRVCVVPQKYDSQICSTGFCVLHPKKEIKSEWLFFSLCANRFYEYIEPLQTGANYPAVSDSVVRSYKLPLPPLTLQQTFAAQIEAIEQQKALIRRSLDETRTLLAARMQYYFE